MTPQPGATAWCPDCHTRRPVEEYDTATYYTPRGEVAQPQAYLSCGHTTTTGPDRITGPAPGAPYAGPDVAVASTTRAADLRAADDRQRVLDADPWETP